MNINVSAPENNLDWALLYAAKGWPIFPAHTIGHNGICSCSHGADCQSPGKHPMTLRGCKDATTDAEIIRKWWGISGSPHANIGLATGERAGLLVIDCESEAGWMELTQGRAWPDTLTAKTGRAGGEGRHYFFRHLAGIKNATKFSTDCDVRTEGGLVIVAPSRHASGECYEWMTPLDTPIANAPQWLVEVLPRHGQANARSRSDARSLVAERPMSEAEATGEAKATGRRFRLDPDLADHQGVGEGERHVTLCRLAGKHFARGESIEEVMSLALDWASKCSPPYPEGEVEHCLHSLWEAHQAKQSTHHSTHAESNGTAHAESNGHANGCQHDEAHAQSSNGHAEADLDDADEVPLPPPPPPKVWPTLHPDALHGLAGEIVTAIAPHTEADVVALLGNLLVYAGNAAGRNIHCSVGAVKHHANLFAVIVGQSAKARKGEADGWIRGLWPDDDPWRSDCVASGLASGEGLIHAVRDSVTKQEPVKDKGKIIRYQPVIEDHGVADKRLLVVESEYARLLSVMAREGNTLSPLIRQAWDTGNLRSLSKQSPGKATGAHISIIGHITEAELDKSLCDVDAMNGFGNRFLWFMVKRSKLLPHGGDASVLPPLQTKLQTALAKARTFGAMTRTAAATALWADLYAALSESESEGIYGALVARGEAQVLRLSMVYALLDGMAEIGVEHLRAAYALWQYCEASCQRLFGEVKEMPPLQKKLLQIITAEPGISRKGLHKATNGHFPTEVLADALAGLRDAQQITIRRYQPPRGRPAECYYALAQSAQRAGEQKQPADKEQQPATEEASEQAGTLFSLFSGSHGGVCPE